MFKRKSWNRRWLAFMALCVFLISVSLPPTLTLAFQPPARVGVIDLLFNTPETGNGTAADWLSGVVMRKGGKDVNVAIAPASGKPAPHIEYADVFNMGPASAVKGVSIPTKGTIDNPLSVLGKRWVVGTKQLVKGGGFGPLKCAGPLGCLEPAGRKVVNLGTDSPDEFKLVLIKISPNEHVAIFEAYVRACLRFHHRWTTCTPYSIPTGFIISLPVRTVMPIDLSVPAFSFKLSPATIANVNSILSKQNLIQAGAGAVTSFSGGGFGNGSSSGGSSSGGSSGGSNSGGSCQTSYGHLAHKEANSADLVSVGNGQQLHKDAAIAFDKMKGAARNAGIDLFVVSGFRTIDRQQDLWATKIADVGSPTVAAQKLAPPGYSEHHTGYAFDVGVDGVANLEEGFENTPAYQWLNKNAGSFGFSQSFTRTSKIGALNEPWHWRFTGTPAAKAEFSTSGCGGFSGSGGGIASSSGANGSGVGTGTFTSPIRGSAPISGRFNDPRSFPRPHLHKGTDFVVPDGTPILAVDGGTAFNMLDPGGYGNFIVIDHGNGYGSLYAHLSTSQVANGQRVSKGQQIGLSGHGGDSTGPHLHFELIKNMTPRDPYSGYAVDALPYLQGY